MPSKYLITLANLITLSGILAALASIWTGYTDHRNWSLGLYLYAALSDFLDGFVARWDTKRGGRGVSKLGQKLDPVRDKLIILILLTVNLQLTAGLAVLEIISFAFAFQVRRKTGRHFITPTSKIITVIQFVVIVPLIILPEESWLFAVLYISTLFRLTSYASKLKEINELATKNRSIR